MTNQIPMLQKSLFSWILLLFLLNSPAIAQYQQQSLFPQLEGQDLLDQLAADFKPATVLDFANARDTLFAKIYLEGDSLPGVYTRHKVFLPPGQDPTQAVFMNGTPGGINTEHTWPQTFGASSGNPRADMHHLHPSKVNVNSDRGNLPFADIVDVDTKKWYFRTRTVTNVPGQSIDEYSELGDLGFEPREDHKGNVARAMFYFYTMYRAQADAQGPNFFNLQRTTLCRWHFDDPVDSLEWHRSNKIATYQDGKANPFVLDCSLPQRSYCSDLAFICTTTSTENLKVHTDFELLPNVPNPYNGTTKISYRLANSAQVIVRIFNVLGELQETLVQEQQNEGLHTIEWTPDQKGVYLYQLEVERGGRYGKQSRLMIAVD